MESNRKRRGILKGKLMPFYRSAKSSTTIQYSNKIMPSQLSSAASTASVGFVVNQDFLVAPPKQKVSFIVPADNSRDKLSQLDMVYGLPGDESVDMKASTYISNVQERFKLERATSERKNHENMK
ncbi:hypothetical protein K2173_027149 [Erythroxylum novogranatense]|uniref:Uncharacterized protein n=1 Tax=Erythroxylum novogranatense TaxID=1862640 RepID=A0AAV8TY84_9ROSI|nr:hypothetical protein K2173_027149 [Erythroxylum novogranatense]